jgi:hypothetical protein
MVNDYPIPLLEQLAPGPGLHNPAARLVTGDDAAITLRAFAKMFPVNRANVAATDGASLHREEELTRTGLRNVILAKLNGAIAG